MSACQSEKTAEATTLLFWSSVAENNLTLAETYCNSNSIPTLLPLQQHNFKDKSFDYGKIVIDGNQATVETKIIPAFNDKSIFTTFLVKEKNDWKVECKRSVSDLTNNKFLQKFVENLESIGNNLNKKLEQQLPIIEKEIESFGQELKQRIESLGKKLNEPSSTKQHDPYQKSI